MYKPKYQEVAAYLHNNEAKSAEVTGKEILISIEDVEIIIDRVVNNLDIPVVSNRRELLTALLQYGKQRHYTPLTEEQIQALVNDFEGSL